MFSSFSHCLLPRIYIILFLFFAYSIIVEMSVSCISITVSNSLSVSALFSPNLSMNLLNLKFLKISKTFSLSHPTILYSSKFSSMGTCILIVPNSLDKYAISLFCFIFSLVFPFSSSVPLSTSLYRFSIEPYFFTRSNAVFSPIPGTPGMLSELSPINPLTSINCFGITPYFSIMACSSKFSVSVFPTLVCGILITIFFVAS